MVHIDRRRFGKDPPTKRRGKKRKEKGREISGENIERSVGETGMVKEEGENQIKQNESFELSQKSGIPGHLV